jgi:hypothetical protein
MSRHFKYGGNAPITVVRMPAGERVKFDPNPTFITAPRNERGGRKADFRTGFLHTLSGYISTPWRDHPSFRKAPKRLIAH